MKIHLMKSTTIVMAIFTACNLLPTSLSASDAIRPYLKSDKSGQFSYAIYNNRWLLHGKRAQEDKHLTRVAITGVLPGAKGKIVIPSTIDGHEVYGIDTNALKSCKGVTEIVIPKTIRFLKPGTLNSCQDLENIVISKDHPDFSSVDGVMFDKKGKTLLAVGAGRKGDYQVPKTATAIGPYALSHCTNLKSIIIPSSVTDIGGHTGSVFLGCKNLESVTIPDTVTNIGQKSFQACSSLKEVAIPAKVTAIPLGLFWRCSNFNKVALPDGITKVGNYAFAECSKMTLQKFPQSLITIGAYAFKNCKALKNLKLPKGVKPVGRGAFSGCDQLRGMDVPGDTT